MGEKRAKYTERGAMMVELAIGLPVLLFFTYLLIFLGTFSNAQLSLDWAVSEGLRLSVTRGDYYRMGNLYIPDLFCISKDYNIVSGINSNCGSKSPSAVWSEDTKKYLSNTNEADEVIAIKYSESIGMTFPKAVQGAHKNYPFSRLPAVYLYALSYVNESMRQSLGRNVRFPCDPNGTKAGDGAGCLQCNFLNPETLKIEEYKSIIIPTRRVGLTCQYALSNSLTKPIYGILSLMTGTEQIKKNLVIESSRRYDREISRFAQAFPSS